jgi:hypothetical protein
MFATRLEKDTLLDGVIQEQYLEAQEHNQIWNLAGGFLLNPAHFPFLFPNFTSNIVIVSRDNPVLSTDLADKPRQ